jgi:hypothetical protein
MSVHALSRQLAAPSKGLATESGNTAIASRLFDDLSDIAHVACVIIMTLHARAMRESVPHQRRRGLFARRKRIGNRALSCWQLNESGQLGDPRPYFFQGFLLSLGETFLGSSTSRGGSISGHALFANRFTGVFLRFCPRYHFFLPRCQESGESPDDRERCLVGGRMFAARLFGHLPRH